MTDEVQTPETPEAAASPAAETEQEAYQRVMNGGVPEPEPEKKAEEPKTVPLDAMLDRVNRVKRQRDEAREESYLRAGQLDELREIVGKLRSIKAEDYPTLEAYDAARRDLDAKADKLTAPERPQISEETLREVQQASRDLAYEVQRADPDLWAEAVAQVDDKPKYVVPPAVVLAIADADDSAGVLRAYLALDDEERQEIIDLSDRGQKKAIRALKPKAKGGDETPREGQNAQSDQAGKGGDDKPARDPATGQFAKRQSSAPPPINPLQGSSVVQKQTSEMTTDEFIAHRNRQEQTDRFGW